MSYFVGEWRHPCHQTSKIFTRASATSSSWSFLERITYYWNYERHGDLGIQRLLHNLGAPYRISRRGRHTMHMHRSLSILPLAAPRNEMEAAYFFHMSPISHLF